MSQNYYWRNRRDILRSEMVEAFGGKCFHCNECDPVVLTLDHVNNDGAEHRKTQSGGHKLYSKLKSLGWPQEGFQLLCHNCNYRKQFFHRRSPMAKSYSVPNSTVGKKITANTPLPQTLVKGSGFSGSAKFLSGGAIIKPSTTIGKIAVPAPAPSSPSKK